MAFPGWGAGFPGHAAAFPGQVAGFPGHAAVPPGQSAVLPGQDTDEGMKRTHPQPTPEAFVLYLSIFSSACRFPFTSARYWVSLQWHINPLERLQVPSV